MDPISNSNRTSSDEPTPAELEAGACLPPEVLECRTNDGPAPPALAVKSLVDKYAPAVSAARAEPPAGNTSERHGWEHPGIALSVGGNLAVGPGIAVGGEASFGVVVDLGEPKISLFTSAGWGTAVAPGASAGVSGQVSAMKDVSKFWGSGAELGLNLPDAGVAANYTTPAPGGARELNGATVSAGPAVGGDGHYFEGTTTEHWSLSLRSIKDALRRAAESADSLCIGP